MKKALLSLVAAGLVGAVVAPAALAEGELGANRNTNESGYWVENNDMPATPGEIKAENDKDLGRVSEELTRKANPLKKGETLKVDKGQAEKANKPAGVKALPKTSAVK